MSHNFNGLTAKMGQPGALPYGLAGFDMVPQDVVRQAD